LSFKKITYRPKTRNDISNNYNNIPHNELLKLANVQVYNGIYEIEKLPNGRINAKIPSKKNKK